MLGLSSPSRFINSSKTHDRYPSQGWNTIGNSRQVVIQRTRPVLILDRGDLSDEVAQWLEQLGQRALVWFFGDGRSRNERTNCSECLGNDGGLVLQCKDWKRVSESTGFRGCYSKVAHLVLDDASDFVRQRNKVCKRARHEIVPGFGRRGHVARRCCSRRSTSSTSSRSRAVSFCCGRCWRGALSERL